MMRSLSSAVAGLRTHQTKMDVIGNNIANVNTYGFKASRTTFADVYYQNLSGGRRGVTGSAGGTNPTQIGYGSAVATIDVMNTVSSAVSTDKPLDVYITGEGFLVSKDASGRILYSRLGNMTFDEAGNLVDGNGNRVQGFPMKADGTPDISPDGTLSADRMQGIWVHPDVLEKLKSISISNSGMITGLMEGDRAVSASSNNPSWLNSNSMSIPANSVYNGSIRLAISGFCDAASMAAVLGPVDVNSAAVGIKSMEMGDLALPEGNYEIEINANGDVKMTFPGDPANNIDSVVLEGSLKNGQLVLANKAGDVGMTITFEDGVNALTQVSGASVELKLYEQMTTQDKGGNVIKEPADGPRLVADASSFPRTVQFGELTFTITGDVSNQGGFNGIIGTAGAGDGIVVNIGNLVLAKFRNPGGLDQVGTSYFGESLNSGEATYVLPGLEGTGGLKSGYLEQSNVDLSKEFTDMITTQRGFQANSRIITVSDEMLQELVNLKR